MPELCPDVQCLGDFMGRSLKDMDASGSFALKLGHGLILILFRFFLGFSSLTSEKLGCQIYHLAMAA